MPKSKPAAPPSPEVLGARLKEVRQMRGVTQAELAEKLGVTQSLVSQFERGEVRLYADVLVAIAKVLRVSPLRLLGADKVEDESLLGSPRLRRLLHLADQLSRRDKQALLRTIEGYVEGRAKKSAS